MKCKVCGAELKENAKFCQQCGNPVELPSWGSGMEEPVEEVEEVQSREKSRKERYTILILAAALAIVLMGGFLVRQLKNGETTADSSGNEAAGSMEDHSEMLSQTQEVAGSTEDHSETPAQTQTAETAGTEENIEEDPEYVLPYSDSRYLSKADLQGMTAEECRLARNEIYARYGRMFKDEALQEYFNSREWYHPSIAPDDFKESMLNACEVANRDLIVEYEHEMGYR